MLQLVMILLRILRFVERKLWLLLHFIATSKFKIKSNSDISNFLTPSHLINPFPYSSATYYDDPCCQQPYIALAIIPKHAIQLRSTATQICKTNAIKASPIDASPINLITAFSANAYSINVFTTSPIHASSIASPSDINESSQCLAQLEDSFPIGFHQKPIPDVKSQQIKASSTLTSRFTCRFPHLLHQHDVPRRVRR